MLASRRPSHPDRKSGAAVVEVVFVVTFVLLPTLTGVWEVGRLLQVQQIVSNAAREGARLGAQGYTISESGTQTKITSGNSASTFLSEPNVRGAVHQSLVGAGLTNLVWSDVTSTFAFTTVSGSNTEPWQGSLGQEFSVSASIPWTKVRWVDFGLLSVTTVSYSVKWRMLVDKTFTVSTALPGGTPR